MLVAIFAIVLCSARACADGKVFASHAAPAEIPDQSALICFDGKTETLAIETRFVAKGKDFAWVVPLPARPEIRAGTPGMFPTLRAMFLPRMWDFQAAGLVIALTGLLCLALLCDMLGSRDAAARVMVWGSLLVLAGMCVFSSSLSAGGGSAAGAVSVLERSVIGDFDVSVVQSTDAGEMKAWLTANGFQSSPQANNAIEDYVKNGWLFVVSKLNRSFDDARVSAPTPLIFQFPVTKPVYPMQLTGAGATVPLKLELFVFGDQFAYAPGFQVVRRAAALVPTESHRYSMRGSVDVQVSHQLLREVIGGAKQATLLRRTLLPDEMGRDIEIQFSGSFHTGNQVCSPLAARQLAFAGGLWGFLLVGSALAFRASQKGPWPAGVRSIGTAIIAGIAVGLAAWTVVPKGPSESPGIDMRRGDAIHATARHALEDLGKRLPASEVNELSITNEMLSIFSAYPEGVQKIRAEDSPGNFVIRRSKDGFDCVYYRWDGQEVAEPLQKAN